MDIFSLISLIVSILGFGATLWQVQKVKKVSDATSQAVSKNREDIKNFLNHTYTVRTSAKITLVINNIRAKKYDLAHHLLTESKNEIIKLHHNIDGDNKKELKSLKSCVNKLKKDIIALSNFIDDSSNPEITQTDKNHINLSNLLTHLEEAKEALILIEDTFQKEKI